MSYNPLFLEKNTYGQITVKLVICNMLFKGQLSGLRQFLATERPLKVMNVFYLTLEALLIF